MQISDEQREKLVQLVEELRELARNERQGGDLRRQQNAIKARFYGHAEAYEDAAKRLEAIVGKPENGADGDPKLLNDGANSQGKG